MPEYRPATALIGLLILCSCGATKQDKLTQIPLLDCSGVPCFEVHVDKTRSERTVLDLGGVASYLMKNTVIKANFLPAPEKRFSVALRGKVYHEPQHVDTDLSIGSKPIGKVTFAVLNPNEAGSFGAIGRDVLPDNILSSSDGGLSFEVFENRLLQIDIQAHRLGISDPIKNTLACPTSCGDIIRGRMGDFGPGIISLSGFAVNGRPVSVR